MEFWRELPPDNPIFQLQAAMKDAEEAYYEFSARNPEAGSFAITRRYNLVEEEDCRPMVLSPIGAPTTLSLILLTQSEVLPVGLICTDCKMVPCHVSTHYQPDLPSTSRLFGSYQ